MVNEIDKITSQYALTISREDKKNDSVFVTYTENTLDLPLNLTLHYVHGDLYAIHFLNNEFFEISSPELILVLRAVLSGDYKVEKSFFRRKKSIKVKSENGYILPEIIHSDAEYANQYIELPRVFMITADAKKDRKS
jgi:hypothetical protein